MTPRTIGRYDGSPNTGPLVVAFAGVHGNETAGMHAVVRVLERLASEKAPFRGTFVGLLGNLRALERGVRFVDRDLNRMWTPENVHLVGQSPGSCVEASELAQLLESVHALLYELCPETLVMLDLHTTSADGGVFVLPARNAPSVRLAKALVAPVVLGLLDGIDGSLLHFAEGNHFAVGGFPKRTVGVAFEGGRHGDPASVDRCAAALLHTLRASGCVDEHALWGAWDEALHRYAASLPKVTQLRYVHHLKPGDGFSMRPGYLNFQPIVEGEVLAHDVSGPVRARCAGRILMPLYQAMGTDGFFVVEDVTP